MPFPPREERPTRDARTEGRRDRHVPTTWERKPRDRGANLPDPCVRTRPRTRSLGRAESGQASRCAMSLHSSRGAPIASSAVGCSLRCPSARSSSRYSPASRRALQTVPRRSPRPRSNPSRPLPPWKDVRHGGGHGGARRPEVRCTVGVHRLGRPCESSPSQAVLCGGGWGDGECEGCLEDAGSDCAGGASSTVTQAASGQRSGAR